MKKLLSYFLVLAIVVSFAVIPSGAVAAGEDIEIIAGDPQVTTTGHWEKGSSLQGPTGQKSWFALGTDYASVTYSASGLEAGIYEVYYYKIVHTSKNDNSLPVSVVHDGGTTTAVVDSSTGESGYEKIGEFTFSGVEGQGVTATRSGKPESVVTRTAAVMYRPIKLAGAAAAMSSVLAEKDYYIYSLFNYIGINSVNFEAMDETITRAEFLAAVMNALSIKGMSNGEDFSDVTENHTYYAEIMCAKALGIVNGDGSGLFRPDEPIRTGEAAKIIVSALDKIPENEQYAVMSAEKGGGYIEGYVSVAAAMGLFKNSSVSGDILTMGDAKTLIMNLFDIEIRNMYDEDETISVIEAVHKIYEGKGIVNALFGESVTDGVAVAQGYIQIGNTHYSLGGITGEGYLGSNVNFYYQDAGIGNAGIVAAMMRNSATNVVEIPADDILTPTLTASNAVNIPYHKNGGSQKTEIVDGTTKVYFNGVLITDRAAADFNPQSGSVVLVSNNGDGQYEYAFIHSYTNIFVKSVDINNEIVYEHFRNDSKNLKDYKSGYEIVKDGRKLDISKIRENDILRVPADRTGTPAPEYAKIVLTRENAEGVIKGLATDEITIDGEKYELSKGYLDIIAALAAEKEKVTVGKAVTVFFDSDGKVAAVEEGDAAVASYAYIRSMALDASGESVKLNAFLADGTWENLELRKSFTYTADGVTKKIKDVDIVEESTFIGDLSSRTETYHYFPEKIYGWDDQTSILCSDNTTKSVWTRGMHTYTYDASTIPSGEYDVSPYIVHNANSGDIRITVTHANGSDSFDVNQSAGENDWMHLGKFEFSGAEGEGITYGKIENDRIIARVADVKFVKSVDLSEMLQDSNVPVNKIVEYKRNADGLVSQIKVLEHTSTTSGSLYKNLAGNVFLTSGNRSVDYTIDENTVIFNIPSDLEKSDFCIVPMSAFGHDATYHTKAYGEDENRYAPVVEVNNFYANALSDQISVGTKVVTNAMTIVDEEGEVRAAIECFDGSKTEVYTASDDSYLAGIGFGDIVVLSFDQKGEAHYVNRIYNFDGSFTGGTIGTARARYGGNFGKVVDIVNNRNTLFISADGNNTKETAELINLVNPTVIICDTVQEEAAAGTTADIQPYDFVAVRTDIQRGRLVVIYR